METGVLNVRPQIDGARSVCELEVTVREQYAGTLQY